MRIVNFRTDRIIRSCFVSLFVYGNFLFSLFFIALILWNLTAHQREARQYVTHSKVNHTNEPGLRVVAQVP